MTFDAFKRPARRLAVAVAAVVLAISAVSAQREEPNSPRARAPLTILQINDVYTMLPVDGLGGLARIATLKQQIAAAGQTPLLMIAGDFLSPSVSSTVFKGAQMVAGLNAAGLDLATFGNHEFDFGTDVLIQRMSEAKFQWLVSNVIDMRTGKPIGNAVPYLVRTFGSMKVGFIGLCLATGEYPRENLTNIQLLDPFESAAKYLPMVERENVDVIVALTHLSYAEDQELIRRFPQIDLIVGGHEHYPITGTENRTLISKAGSDAKYVARIDVNVPKEAPGGTNLPAGRTVERFYELIPVTAALSDEPRTAEVIRSYESKLSSELETVVGTSTVPLDADTVRLRASETNLGNLVADAIRAHVGTDVAILNSGSIRGDRIFPPGPLTRRTLLTIHPFGNVVCKVEAPGRIIVQALNNGVSKLPATAGPFPQVSGMSFRVNPNVPVGSRIMDVTIGGQPLDPDKVYSVALADFMLMGGDGYGMFADQRVLIGPEAGDLVADALEQYVAAKRTVSPAVEGRIQIDR